MTERDQELIDRVAKALWDSEPVIYAWGPQERHHVTWEEAVARNLAGVGIFRAFASAAIEAVTANGEIERGSEK